MTVNKEFLIQQIEINGTESFLTENKKLSLQVDYTLHPFPNICEDYALLRAGHSNQISIPDWNDWCKANNASHLIL